jgi:hypothetical protein
MNWNLPSNSGRQLSTWTVNDQTAEHLSCDFEFRSQSVESDQPESVIRFSRLILTKSKLLEFVEVAREWLAKPLSDAASASFEVSVDMGGGFDTYVQLRFGESPSVISAQNNAVTIDYCVAGVDGELTYVVDQSCLREMTEGITTALGVDG